MLGHLDSACDLRLSQTVWHKGSCCVLQAFQMEEHEGSRSETDLLPTAVWNLLLELSLQLGMIASC